MVNYNSTQSVHKRVIWTVPRPQFPQQTSHTYQRSICLCPRAAMCPSFFPLWKDDWSQRHGGAEGTDRQTDRGTERGSGGGVGGGGCGVKPQFLYVVWLQFGKSRHSPVHWGGKPDEYVLECCLDWALFFFSLSLFLFFFAPNLLHKAAGKSILVCLRFPSSLINPV